MKSINSNEQVVDSFMKTAVESNLLKYAAGQNIFCPACQDIMDWRRTVIATVYGVPRGHTEETIAKQFVSCAKCFDRRRVHLDKAIEGLQGSCPEAKIRLELVDGRDERFNDLD